MDRIKSLTASALIALSLTACGGGGSGATSNDSTNTTTKTVISGMASKGPITGTVKIYALNADGIKGSLLTTSTIKPEDNGKYSANIGNYAGPVIIEVSGSYKDEATGNTLTIDDKAPLRAVLSNASDTVNAAVTPLTELAVRKTGALTPSNIDYGNKLVSDIFKIDIINTQPIAPEKDALSKEGVTQSQKDYTLALAAISQLSKNRDNEPLSDTLANVAKSITYNGMDSLAVANFQKAVTAFIANPNNTNADGKKVFTDDSAASLAKINGAITASYKLAITGPKDMAANAIKGLQFEVVIPAGLTVRYDTSGSVSQNPKIGETLSEVVKPLNSALLDKDSSFITIYNASNDVSVLSFGLYTTTGIGAGELATITCDVLPGWTAPPASAFSVRKDSIKAVKVDIVNGISNITTLDNVNVTVTAN